METNSRVGEGSSWGRRLWAPLRRPRVVGSEPRARNVLAETSQHTGKKRCWPEPASGARERLLIFDNFASWMLKLE